MEKMELLKLVLSFAALLAVSIGSVLVKNRLRRHHK